MLQLMHSFQGYTAPAEVIEAVRRGQIAAFCLFAYNVQSPAQLRELTRALHMAARDGGQLPPLIGIDQEGGQLMAITGGATELPGNMALGAANSPDLARQVGRVLARELRAMGCNLNFAPVLDLNSNPDNPVIGVRSFGDDPSKVAELGAALIVGMQAEGVMATAKHFPGHGDASGDSHYTTPSVNRSAAALLDEDLRPFRRAVAEGVGAIMSAHVVYPAFDVERPATLSPRILTGLLREEMGYDGLIITDAMDMQAVSVLGAEASVRAALEAGADLVLLGHLPGQLALSQQLQTVERGAALDRIRRARERLPDEFLPLDVVGCEEHQQVARAVAQASITVARDDGRLPLRLNESARMAVITAAPADLTPADSSSSVSVQLAEAVRKRHGHTTALQLPRGAGDAAVRDALQAAESAEVVLVGTINADQDAGQAELVRALLARGQQPIVVALRHPYDVRAFPHVTTYLCTYSIRSVSTEAAVGVIFGEIAPQGKLPCRVPGIAPQ